MEATSWQQRIAAWPAEAKSYLQDVQMEMKRVTWPNWKQVRATTLVVIVSVFAFSAYFYVVDLLVARGINKVFAVFAR